MKPFKQIIRKAARSLARDRTDSERQLGDQRRAVGDWLGAAANYRQHLARRPDDMGIWVQLGHALKESGNYDDAEAAYRTAHRLDSENADLFLSRGHLAKLRRRFDTAADFYNRSFLIDNNPEAARELADLATLEGEPAAGTTTVHLGGALESVNEGVLIGWVVDQLDITRRASVEILHEGVVVGVAEGVIPRPDLIAAGLAQRPAGFRFDLAGLGLEKRAIIAARVLETQEPLVGSPMVVEPSADAIEWLNRHADLLQADRDDLVERSGVAASGQTLSIITDLAAAEKNSVGELMDSLEGQWCSNWEMVCALAPTTSAAVGKLVRSRAAKDSRIRILPFAAGKTSDTETEAWLFEVRGDYIVSLRPDSILEPEAVLRILDAARSEADMIYWDEVKVGASPDSIVRFVTRPVFSWDHFLGDPEFFGAAAVSRKRLEALATAPLIHRPALSEMLLASDRIAHIPAVLERSRAVSQNGAELSESLDRARKGLERQLRETAATVEISDNSRTSGLRLDAKNDSARDLVVVLAGDNVEALRRSVETALTTTLRNETDLVVVAGRLTSDKVRDYIQRINSTVDVEDDESSSAERKINDLVARTADLYGYVTLIESGAYPSASWHESLRSLAGRDDIGIAAPILTSSGGVVESAGVFLRNNTLVNSHQGVVLGSGLSRSAGWSRSLVSRRNQSAATGCVMMRTSTFLKVGGLDVMMTGSEALADLCLRMGQVGLAVVVDPEAIARCRKLPATRQPSRLFQDRWAEALSGGDVYHHPLLDDHHGISDPAYFLSPTRIVSGVGPGSKGGLTSVARLAVDRGPSTSTLRP